MSSESSPVDACPMSTMMPEPPSAAVTASEEPPPAPESRSPRLMRFSIFTPCAKKSPIAVLTVLASVGSLYSASPTTLPRSGAVM